ncbi:MBL fold metallo-hydrolase [Clostridiaceae bacterium M8S5]|nr:MBL fold metallo-hydrolase [Clostridiaceae bacterium M8S5]
MEWFNILKKDNKSYIIREHLHWEKTNMYYLVGEEYNLLIDSGTGITRLKEVLKHIDDKEIRVVSTHVHWDHIGNHCEFDNIYVHEREFEWIKNGIPLPTEVIKNNLYRGVDSKYINHDYKKFKSESANIIKQGYEFNLGNRNIEVIDIPGHSPGHIALLDREKRDIYVGDTLYQGRLFCNYESTDPLEYYKSIEKLYNMRHLYDNIMCGHYKALLDKTYIIDAMTLMENIKHSKNLHHGSGVHIYKNLEIIM